LAPSVRAYLDQSLDWLSFGLRRAGRAEGVDSRMAAVMELLERHEVRTALDVGCNIGAFSFALARRGISTLGVEDNPHYYRTALYAARRLRITNFALLVCQVNDETLWLLPQADLVLFLSVWHHTVRSLGLERASRFVTGLWERTGWALLFETGEREMPAEFGLPEMDPDPRSWIDSYLTSVCPGGTVEHLGEHRAVAPDGTKCLRNLYAVVRDGAAG
jgi:hypothetical protein